MEIVIVERSFTEPQVFSELQAVEDAHAWCLELHGVVFLGTFFSHDRRRMICVYEAPDAEAVRRTNETARMPYDRIWAASVHPGRGFPAPLGTQPPVGPTAGPPRATEPVAGPPRATEPVAGPPRATEPPAPSATPPHGR